MAQLTPADLLERVGMPAPTTPAESEAVLECAIDVVLKKEGGSGFRDVYKCASAINPWQAKPYIRPKVQRNLGSFPTPAAKAVIIWMFGGRPTPPTPTKERNKRGVGRKPRDRSNKGEGARLTHRVPRLPFSQSYLPLAQVAPTSARPSTGPRKRSWCCSRWPMASARPPAARPPSATPGRRRRSSRRWSSPPHSCIASASQRALGRS